MNCDRCKGLLGKTYDQYERRMEYRRVRGLKRERTWRLELLCRRCAEADWEAHDQPQGEQLTLWGKEPT
jgi:hypothetical protein